MLQFILQKFWQKPHLRGLKPIHKSVNYYWQRVWSMDNLQEAYAWLCEQSDDFNHDVWDYRNTWNTRQFELQFLLRSEQFAFQPVRIVEVENAQGEIEQREEYCAEDRLVIRAIEQVLSPVFNSYLSSSCTHLKGNGGIKQAVRDTQLFLATHPDAQVFKSDVKSYYASIDHVILAEQLDYCLPNEVALHRVIWQFMRRTTEFGGNDVERGLPLGASLSPLFGAVHLAPLDALGDSLKTGFYRRYMDDWVMVVPKKQQLRKLIKDNYAVLQALHLRVHPDKTFIGKVSKGFDFLGFHCSPTCLRVSQTALSRRDKKIARLYEQGASKKRIAQYLARWFGWAGLVPFNAMTYPIPETGIDYGNNFPALIVGSGGTPQYSNSWTDGQIKGTSGHWGRHSMPVFIAFPSDNFPAPEYHVRVYSYTLPYNNPSKAPSVRCNEGIVTGLVNSTSVELDDGDACELRVVPRYQNNSQYHETKVVGTLRRTGIYYLLTDGISCGNEYNEPCPSEIEVHGGDINTIIANGDSTPSIAKNTDFGTTCIDNCGVPKMFWIENEGMGDLTLTGNPKVELTNCAMFSIIEQPSTTISAGSNDLIIIQYEPTSIGTHNCTVNIENNDSDRNPYTFTITGTGNKREQEITGFTPSLTGIPGGSQTLSATGGGSGNPVTFASSTTGVCTTDGTNNATLTYVGSGTCTVTADQAGNANYDPAPQVTKDITVSKVNQSISGFTPATSGTYGGSATLSATASSGLTVSFGTTTGSICSVSGTTVNFDNSGTCIVTADQAGNSNYNPASQVTKNITINKANQSISGFSPTTSGTYGGNATLSATASSGLAVTFGTTTSGICSVSGTTVNFDNSGTCTVTADQAGNSNYNAAPQVTDNITISGASQTITFSPTTSGIYGGSQNLTATGGGSGNPVTFASSTTDKCTLSGSTLNYVGAGTCTITANQIGNANYDSAPQVTKNITINKASQTISNFSPTPTGIYGSNAILTATGGGSTSSVTFGSNTTSVCTVSSNTVNFINTGTCTVTANQADDSNYNAASQATANITVSNTTPTTSNSSIITNEDIAKTGTLSATDSDGNSLTYSIDTNGTKGTAVIDNTSTGAFTYTPNANANGADSFTFKVNDGLADSATATVNVTINAVNDQPTFTESAPHAITLNEDNNATASTIATAYNFNLNATDIDANTLTWTIQTNGTNGTASVSGTTNNGSPTKTISYTPNNNYNGNDSFVVKIDDGNGGTNTLQVNVTVNAVNDIPTITQTSPHAVTINEDNSATPAIATSTYNFTLNANDIDGNTLTWSISSPASNGTASTSGTGTSKSISYTPNVNFYGTDTFDVQITDGQYTATIPVNMTISAINDTPTFSESAPHAITLDEDNSSSPATLASAYTFDLNASDIENHTLTWTIQTQATNGTASVSGTTNNGSPTKTINYTPNTNYFGADSFVVKIDDSNGQINTIQVDVTVNPINDIPTITHTSPHAVTIDEDNSASPAIATSTYNFTLNANDIDGNTLTWSISSPASNGTASASGTGTSKSISYTPNVNFYGTDTFDVQITDGQYTATIPVNMTISAINDTPTFSESAPHAITLDEDNSSSPATLASAYTFNLNANDIENHTLTWTIQTQATNGTASVSGTTNNGSPTKTISYTPNNNYFGADSFVVKIDDGNGQINTIQVDVTVNPINDIPTITQTSPHAVTINEDNSATPAIATSTYNFNLDANDIDGNTLTWSISSPASNGTASASGTGTSKSISYTPNVNFNGSDTFDVQITDGQYTATILVNMTITPINDIPTFIETSPHPINLDEDNNPIASITTSAYSFDLNATDIDANTLTWSIQTQATNGTASVSGTTNNGSPTKTISYTPNLDYNGTDSFIVQIDDSNGGTNLITVNATINPINDIPTVVPIDDINVIYGAPTQTFNLYDYFADVDNLDSELTYILLSNTDDSVIEPSITDNILTVVFKQVGSSDVTLKAVDPDGLEVETSFNATIIRADTSIEITQIFPSPSAPNQEVGFSFTVTPASGTGITGDVTITDGVEICTKTLTTSHNGSSVCRMTFTELASLNFNASYAGDRNYNPSSTKQIISHRIKNALIVYTTRLREEYKISENGVGDIYYVELSTYPSYPVNLTITPDEQLSINGETAGQSVTITLVDAEKAEIAMLPVDDDVLEGFHDGLVTHVASSADINYDGKTTEIAFPIIDNEAGIVINQTDGLTQLLEGEQADNYNVRLSVEPVEQVKINIMTDTAQVSAYPTSLTFSRSNWDKPQSVRLSATDDQDIEGEHYSIVTHEIISQDTLYGSDGVQFTIDEQQGDGLNVSIIDNDVAQPPLAPTQLSASINESNQVILNWLANSLDETSFIILRDEQILAEMDADAVSYTDTDLACGITYNYQIIAHNEIGDSLPSATASIEFPCLELSMPENLTATAISDTQIDLSWTDNNTTEIGYQIIRDGHILNNITPNSTHFTDANLQCGTEYHYLVSAIAPDLTISLSAQTFAFTQNCLGEFSLGLNIQGQGSVNDCTRSCKQGYPQNQTVALNAIPAVNWQFSHWSGDCSSGQVILDTDKTCTAYFIEQEIIQQEVQDIVEQPIAEEGGDIVEQPVEEVIILPPITDRLPITEIPAELLPPPPATEIKDNSTLDQSANIAGETVININIQPGSSVSNGTLGGEVTNSGLVSNVTIEEGATISGGSISGSNVNEGTMQDVTITAYSEVSGGSFAGEITNRGTLTDVQFTEGSVVTGGELGGVVKSEGVIMNVELQENARIVGGIIGGEIKGTKSNPAYLGSIEILEGAKLENVRISPTTKLPEGVEIGEGVIFPKSYTNPDLEDFGINEEGLQSIDVSEFNGIEPAAFELFEPEHIEQLPLEVFAEFEAEDIANLPPETVEAIEVEQFEQLPDEALEGLTADNVDALSTEVLAEAVTPEKLESIKPEAIKKSKKPGKIFTKLKKIKPRQAKKYLPKDWDINEETGELSAPAGTKLTYQEKQPKQKVSKQKASLPEIADLGSSFSLGGTGGKTAQENLNEGMQQTPAVSDVDLDQFVFTQNDDTGMLNIVGEGDYEGTKFVFLPGANNIEQAPLDTPVGLSQDEGDFFIMTTPNYQSFFLTPATNDPVGLVEVLTGEEVAEVEEEESEARSQGCGFSDQVVKFNETGDVLLTLTSESTRRIRAFETEVHIVVIFNPFVEPAPSQYCDDETCDWPIMPNDLQRGLHLPDKLRARQQAKVIYPDGTAQIVYPTVLDPVTFITVASEFEGVENVIYQADGSFKANYFGQAITIYPTFDTTLKPLPSLEIEIQPEIIVQDNGQILYSVQDCSRLVTTYLVFE